MRAVYQEVILTCFSVNLMSFYFALLRHKVCMLSALREFAVQDVGRKDTDSAIKFNIKLL